MEIKITHFKDLSAAAFYEIAKLRVNVFVVEQDCAYPEFDDKDISALHVQVFDGNNLVAYARLLPKGSSYEHYSSIGRVVVHEQYRGQQLGYLLMNKAIVQTILHFGGPIKLSAQAHLESFYHSLGFEPTANRYLEDGIPHISMLYNVTLV